MKKIIAAISILFFSYLLFMSCKKNEQLVLKPRFYITLKNDSAKPVSGATVRLYKDALDPGIILTSDSSGSVLFENLEPLIYYWYAQKGCSTNMTSQYTLNRVLIEDVVLYGNSVMRETGVLKITNTTNQTYTISDSFYSASVHIDTPYIAQRKIGSYRIRSENVNNPGVFKDTILQVNCADTTRLVLPY